MTDGGGGRKQNIPVLERRCIFEAAALASAEAFEAAMLALLAGAVLIVEVVILVGICIVLS
jgi:hypothetical protein